MEGTIEQEKKQNKRSIFLDINVPASVFGRNKKYGAVTRSVRKNGRVVNNAGQVAPSLSFSFLLYPDITFLWNNITLKSLLTYQHSLFRNAQIIALYNTLLFS
jgi:hypothetical protein